MDEKLTEQWSAAPDCVAEEAAAILKVVGAQLHEFEMHSQYAMRAQEDE